MIQPPTAGAQALPGVTIEVKEVVFGGVTGGKPHAIRLHEFHASEGTHIAYTWHMRRWFAS